MPACKPGIRDLRGKVSLGRNAAARLGVQAARTGEEALEALRATPLPDAILLDIDMPVLGGPGMAHKMMLHDAGQERIPIILSSGRDDLATLAAKMGTP